MSQLQLTQRPDDCFNTMAGASPGSQCCPHNHDITKLQAHRARAGRRCTTVMRNLSMHPVDNTLFASTEREGGQPHERQPEHNCRHYRRSPVGLIPASNLGRWNRKRAVLAPVLAPAACARRVHLLRNDQSARKALTVAKPLVMTDGYRYLSEVSVATQVALSTPSERFLPTDTTCITQPLIAETCYSRIKRHQ
jgi:hypothetical protein